MRFFRMEKATCSQRYLTIRKSKSLSGTVVAAFWKKLQMMKMSIYTSNLKAKCWVWYESWFTVCYINYSPEKHGIIVCGDHIRPNESSVPALVYEKAFESTKYCRLDGKFCDIFVEEKDYVARVLNAVIADILSCFSKRLDWLVWHRRSLRKCWGKQGDYQIQQTRRKQDFYRTCSYGCKYLQSWNEFC